MTPKKSMHWLLVGLLLLTAGRAHAEGNCPPGYYPIGAQEGQAGPQGCAPIPGYNRQQLPSAPPPKWATSWGAIATDSVKGTLGTAINLPSKEEAKQAALTNCQSKGGTRCMINVAYDNECAAMVVGDSGYNATTDTTLNKAVQSGMETCTAATTNCHVYYSACSMPIRIQ